MGGGRCNDESLNSFSCVGEVVVVFCRYLVIAVGVGGVSDPRQKWEVENAARDSIVRRKKIGTVKQFSSQGSTILVFSSSSSSTTTPVFGWHSKMMVVEVKK